MDIHIGSGVRNEQLKATAQERFGSALAGCSKRIQRVEIRLGAGAAGRHDAFCVAQLHLFGAPAGTVIEIDSDPRRAIHRAADRARKLAHAQVLTAAREAWASKPRQRARRQASLRTP